MMEWYKQTSHAYINLSEWFWRDGQPLHHLVCSLSIFNWLHLYLDNSYVELPTTKLLTSEIDFPGFKQARFEENGNNATLIFFENGSLWNCPIRLVQIGNRIYICIILSCIDCRNKWKLTFDILGFRFISLYGLHVTGYPERAQHSLRQINIWCQRAPQQSITESSPE